jgi:FAD/FMN-containing dehydrogenase
MNKRLTKMATAYSLPNDPFADFDPSSLITDPTECDFYAQDVFTKGPAPIAVFRPASIEELAQGVGKATAQGIAIVPRGGGMSYTSGYVANDAGALIIDLGRMARILEINETDMTVKVEAGCSWNALYEALHPKGLRTPLWGSLSGIKASIGGGMSQNGLFWGSRSGTMAHNSICYEVVLADGSVVKTGSDFLRPFGPDLTGLFGADAGALGVKAHIILPLIHDGEAFGYGSFAFDAPEHYCAAMSEIGRRGLVSEAFGFDPFLQSQRMKRDSLTSDAKQLLGMMKSQGGFWKGLKEGAKVVVAGRSFLDDATFSIHLICEGRSQAAVDDDMRRVEAIVTHHGGRIVENTIPKILRANPFPPVNSMVGPEGERWVPVHGIVRHSKALQTINAITQLFAAHEAEMERLGVGAGYMFLVVGTTGFLIEPVFYWPDAQEEIHRRSVEPAHMAKLKSFDANPEARAMVEKLRGAIIDIFGQMDAIHFQIGRTYPLKDRSDPGAWAILEAVKAAVDPKGLMNPGVLGL